MRILITGSRTWTHLGSVNHAITKLAREAAALGEALTVVHGDALGADKLAATIVRSRQAGGWQITAEAHPAKWQVGGRGAGMARNKRMVELGADICVAFLRQCEAPKCPKPGPHDTHGATQCAELAEKAGIPVVRVLWDDRDNYRAGPS